VPGSTYWYSMALDVELWNNSTQTQAVQINMSQYSRLAGSGYGGYPNGYHSWWFWNVSVPYPSGVVGPYYYPPKTVLGVQWPELPVPDLSVPESGPFTHSYVNGWDTYQSAQIYLNGKPDGPKYTWTVIGPDDYGSPVLTPPPPCQKPPAVSYYLIILVLAITFTFLLAAKRPKTGPQ